MLISVTAAGVNPDHMESNTEERTPGSSLTDGRRPPRPPRQHNKELMGSCPPEIPPKLL